MTTSDSDINNTPEKQQSIEAVASPEGLDQLMQVVKPKDFIPALTVGGLTALVGVWSIVGRIPLTVEGQGAFISSQKVVELQSAVAGQLESISIQDNQCVEKGQVLATVKPTELEEQLKQQKAKRQQLILQAVNTNSLQTQRTQVEREAIATTRNSLSQKLQDLRSLSPTLREQTLTTLRQQRETLQQRLRNIQATATISRERDLSTLQQQRRALAEQLKDVRELNPVLKDRLERRRKLQVEGAISLDTVLESENDYRENRQQIARIEAQLQELNSREVSIDKSFRENRDQALDIQAQLQALNGQETTVEKSFRENRSQVTDIQAQLQELETRDKRLQQENLQTSNSQKNEILEVDRTIAQLEQDIKERSQIVSGQAGCVLEVSAVVGQVMSPGMRIGTLQTQEQGKASLTSIAYFDVKDGKRIKPGMTVYITPDTVKRERYGGIVATVKSVSAYPVASSTAIAKLGNAELADILTGKTAKVEVMTELVPEPSNFSGYKWSSSKGPNMKLTPGTTAALRVKVEEQAPITFLLPFLREWSGLQ